ncbi:MAG: hypothetical protein ACOYXT_15695 [Bacteroidota bacterium]
MKTMLVPLILIVLCVTTKAQSKSDSLYIVTYTTSTGWDYAKKPHEQPYFKEHSAHLSALRKAGTIKMGARYADKGIIVIVAPSHQSAREIVESDQAIVNRLFQADVQKLSVFYEGCVTKVGQ